MHFSAAEQLLRHGSAFQIKNPQTWVCFCLRNLGVCHPSELFGCSLKLAYISRKILRTFFAEKGTHVSEVGTFFSKNDPQKWVWVSKLGQHTPSKTNLRTLQLLFLSSPSSKSVIAPFILPQKYWCVLLLFKMYFCNSE